jgi:CDP-glucose 4,6-dehydratase
MNTFTAGESQTPLQSAFKGKIVWVSGHTGFKGSWLTQWLLDLGAVVHGFSLPPPTTPALFDQLGLAQRMQHRIADLRNATTVTESIQTVQPDYVFHLGAQAIVRLSFEQPVETYMTNVLGTIHVMEALRTLNKPCVAIFVSSDKCYENRELLLSYREEDPLGGFDPYSSSKAGAEIAIASWRRSFFAAHPVRFASVRAGNVIGGGDFARDRILPDCVQALRQNQPIAVRNKVATRPWQHVLEPLSGYLWLAAVMSKPSLRPQDSLSLASAFNFGPSLDSNRTVAELVNEVLKHWPGKWEDKSDSKAVHEARFLNLAADKAFHLLGWKSVWRFEKAVEAAVRWYREDGDLSGTTLAIPQLIRFTSGQIAEYQKAAALAGLPWAAEPAGA